jgi:hypothetical protein
MSKSSKNLQSPSVLCGFCGFFDSSAFAEYNNSFLSANKAANRIAQKSLEDEHADVSRGNRVADPLAYIDAVHALMLIYHQNLSAVRTEDQSQPGDVRFLEDPYAL